mmetsp:Transcript_41701/g.109985  ORF Transcript_41701/g.109985 Transcript_41701/m.109985 type:complete len:318 (+) Transcript_41701:79-1032(+)
MSPRSQPPGTSHLPKDYLSDRYVNWEGCRCREDPQRAFLKDERAKKRAEAHDASRRRADHVADLRQARERLHGVLRYKAPPFDEFTVFGLPSAHGIPVATTAAECLEFVKDTRRVRRQMYAFADAKTVPWRTQAPYDDSTVFGLPSNHGVQVALDIKDCLKHGSPPSSGASRTGALSARESSLREQIGSLEKHLQVGTGLIQLERRRPVSARDPSTYHAPRPPPPREVKTGRVRRPMSSVGAYRRSGLNQQQMAWLPANAAQTMESFRGASKAQEQMLLGHLKAAQGKILAERPLWKIKRFEVQRPRGVMNLMQLEG